jgi:hypothetical protein
MKKSELHKSQAAYFLIAAIVLIGLALAFVSIALAIGWFGFMCVVFAFASNACRMDAEKEEQKNATRP